MHELPRLSTVAGVKLLRTIGVKTGSQGNVEKLVEDVDGHALILQILGQFLVRAFQGDIRRRDRIGLEKADARIQGGHPFRADETVYYARILRRDENYRAKKHGAFGSDLGGVACFFETPWSRVSSALPAEVQAWYLNQAAFRVRALRRLTEAPDPLRAGLEIGVRQEN